jgi:hypothetical protein
LLDFEEFPKNKQSELISPKVGQGIFLYTHSSSASLEPEERKVHSPSTGCPELRIFKI